MKSLIRLALSMVLLSALACIAIAHPLSQSERNDIGSHLGTIATCNAHNEDLFDWIDILEFWIWEEEQEPIPDEAQIDSWELGIDIANFLITDNNNEKIDAVQAINAIYDSHGHT